jgi:hypothetical protein
MAVLARLAPRLAAGAGLIALGWSRGGTVPVVLAAVATALLILRPLIELAGELRHRLREAAWREVEGRHYAFRGRPIQVLEDADRRRWVRIDDVRSVVGFSATDGALELTYPAGFRRLGRDAFLSDEALVVHLAREPTPAALKLRHWAEREIVFPARRVRARLGIRTAAPETKDDV